MARGAKLAPDGAGLVRVRTRGAGAARLCAHSPSAGRIGSSWAWQAAARAGLQATHAIRSPPTRHPGPVDAKGANGTRRLASEERLAGGVV